MGGAVLPADPQLRVIPVEGYEAILEGAFQSFSRHGYAATTLAAIARSAKVS